MPLRRGIVGSCRMATGLLRLLWLPAGARRVGAARHAGGAAAPVARGRDALAARAAVRDVLLALRPSLPSTKAGGRGAHVHSLILAPRRLQVGAGSFPCPPAEKGGGTLFDTLCFGLNGRRRRVRRERARRESASLRASSYFIRCGSTHGPAALASIGKSGAISNAVIML